MQKLTSETQANLTEIALLFLKLGVIGFGGPAAHIAMMQQEVVVKRNWMSEQHFLDLLGVTNLIPGPNSTELALHIGREKAGWIGLLVAGACFILPAVLITCIFAWLYSLYGRLPQVQPFVYGIKPAIIAVIVAAVYPLAKRSLKSVELGMIGIAALLLSLIGVNEMYVLFGAGLIAFLLVSYKGARTNGNFHSVLPVMLLQISTANLGTTTSNLKLLLIFLKIGAILYGSGYVLFAYMDTELVAKGIITHQQLTDAIAAGQLTPGPVFSSVTFIGYQVGGLSGAVLSTVGVFLPSFLFVALLNPLVRRIRKSVAFSAFLDAVNIASVAVILSVCLELTHNAVTDWRTILIGAASLVILYKFQKINSAVVVLGGAGLGYLLSII